MSSGGYAKSMSPIRWEQLRSACARTLAAAPDAADVGWHDLRPTCTRQRWCNVTEHGATNHRPVVSTVDAHGLLSGVLYPGNWQPDWWADGWEAEHGAWRAQSNATTGSRGSNLLRRFRIVTVRNAVVTSTGSVLARGRRFGVEGLRRCALQLPSVPGQADTCSRPLGHVVVLQQLWADSFSHIFFQLLPQLALVAIDAFPSAPDVMIGPSQRYSSPHLPAILLHAFGIQPDRIIRASRGQAYHVARATVLQLPPGNCPHAAVYPHGVLRRSWAKLRVGLPHTDEHDRVVYLRRPCPMRRCVVNEAAMLRAVRSALVAPYELVVVDQGSSHTGDEYAEEQSSRHSLQELQALMARAKVVLGVCGSAWGNAFWADAGAPGVHFVELNNLHGRASFVKMHHYVGGPSRYWVLEPRFGTQGYESQVQVAVGPLIVALHHAGVARCASAPPAPEPGESIAAACDMRALDHS